MPDTAPNPHAPGPLEFVREFVNTLDRDAGTDRFSTPDSWVMWAHEHGIEGRTDRDELARAVALRESIRLALLANHDRLPLPESTSSALADAVRGSRAQVAFTSSGLTLVVGPGSGMDTVISRVVSASADALADGTWTRLKACAYDSCQWAFYDHSRSRTGRWCSMEICGNRAKQARWRSNQAP